MGNADRHRQRQQQLVTRSIAEGDAVWDANKLTLSKRKAASKRAQRKSLLLLCRAGAGSSAQSAVKAESCE